MKGRKKRREKIIENSYAFCGYYVVALQLRMDELNRTKGKIAHKFKFNYVLL